MNSTNFKRLTWILLVVAVAIAWYFRSTFVALIVALILAFAALVLSNIAEKMEKQEKENKRTAQIKADVLELLFVSARLSEMGYELMVNSVASRRMSDINVTVTLSECEVMYKKPQFHAEDFDGGTLWILDDENEPLNGKLAIFFLSSTATTGCVFYKE